MRIKVSELKDLSTRLLCHLEEQGYSDIEISDDYYWEIPKERYDPYVHPSDFTLGQLTHDWERLQSILRGEDEPLAYGLVWLSAVLRAIGERIVH